MTPASAQRSAATLTAVAVCLALFAGCGTEAVGKSEYQKRIAAAAKAHEKRAGDVPDLFPTTEDGDNRAKVVRSLEKYRDSLDTLVDEAAEVEPDNATAKRQHERLVEALKAMSEEFGSNSELVDNYGALALRERDVTESGDKIERRIEKAADALSDDGWLTEETADRLT